MGFPTRLMVSGPESRRVLGELAGDAEAWSKALGPLGERVEVGKKWLKPWCTICGMS
jgi:hypothetical protein